MVDSGDSYLRALERAYYAEPSCQAWTDFLRESRRRGKQFFTRMGVITATGGTLLDFRETNDGFRAEVTNAVFPSLPALVPLGDPTLSDDHKEYITFDRWSGYIYLECLEVNSYPPYPSLIIDAQLDFLSNQGSFFYTQGGVYVYEQKAILNNQDLIQACTDKNYYPINNAGWGDY